MQRFLLSAAGVIAVIFAFFVFTNAQSDGSFSDSIQEILNGDSAAAAPPTSEAPIVEEAAPAAPDQTPQSGTAAADALIALEGVSVTPATRIKAYSVEEFGTPWADVDGNGCDTRNDIFARDLTVTAMEGSCTVLTGTLEDPYTGNSIDFVRGKATSSAVQIDHIVSRSAVWKAGAHAWTPEQRLTFANDPASLLTTDGPTNGSKKDRGPASWMPSAAGNASFDCAYAISYTGILSTYQLTAPAADLAAVRETLALCA